MTGPDPIHTYQAGLSASDQAICAALRAEIDAALPDAESKVWHGHPVWFLGGNPVVGYSRLKDAVRLLFWSGQSFSQTGLCAEGKFKAADLRIADLADLDLVTLRIWLRECRETQWDYKNIVRRKGVLERLT